MSRSIHIRGRDFTISERPAKDRDGRIVYVLSGKRGASYFTMRNVHRPSEMFVCNARRFGITSGFEGVWLSDDSGELRVVTQ